MTWTDLTDGVEDPAVHAWLEQLAALGDTAVPEPGDELAALFAGHRVVSIDSAGSRARRRVGAAGLAAAVLLTGGVGAAAAEVLPRPAQKFVAGLVRTLTPFTVPEPGDTPPEQSGDIGRNDLPTEPVGSAPDAPADRADHPRSTVTTSPAPGPAPGVPGSPRPTTTDHEDADDVVDDDGSGPAPAATQPPEPVDDSDDVDDADDSDDDLGSDHDPEPGVEDAAEPVEVDLDD